MPLTDKEKTAAALLAAEYLILTLGYSPSDASDVLSGNVHGVSKPTLYDKFGKRYKALCAAHAATAAAAAQPAPLKAEAASIASPLPQPLQQVDAVPAQPLLVPPRLAARNNQEQQQVEATYQLSERAAMVVLEHDCSIMAAAATFGVNIKSLARRCQRARHKQLDTLKRARTDADLR